MTFTPEERERQAREEVGRTDIGPAARLALVGCFIGLLAGGLGWHVANDLRERPGRWPQVVDPTRLAPVWDEVGALAGTDGWLPALALANQRVGVNIADYETSLEERSPLVDALVPAVNLMVTGWLGGATESVYPGRDGWLFYRPDVEYVTTRGFLDDVVLETRRRADPEIEPDPLPALVELRDALAARDIALLVVPAPLKSTIYPDRYSTRFAAQAEPLQNRSYARWLDRLAAAGVPVVDLAAVLWDARDPARPLYLERDTHWTPAGVRTAAGAMAEAIDALGIDWTAPQQRFTTAPATVTNQGDTFNLLRLPESTEVGTTETVTVDQVRGPDGQPWRPEAAAEILLLGDSFANIYSLAGLGWGPAAGLAEQLSAMLGRPLDALRQNDAGSYATRQMLAAARLQGRNRLAGKRLVIYEFAARELAFGDWRTGLPY